MSTVPETGTLGQLCEELYGTSTTVSVRQEWEQAVRTVADKAAAVLPAASAERIQKAVRILAEHRLEMVPNGQARVESSGDEGRVWHVSGTVCNCPDYHRAPAQWCKHRIARALYLRALRSIKRTTAEMDAIPAPSCSSLPAPSLPDSLPPTTVRDTQVADIPAAFLVALHGKQFVTYAGLLALAHQRGLVSLTARFISVTGDCALADATAVFSDGRTFSDAADSTPSNVGSKIKAHFPRMALTRAKARCLRDALNIGMVSLEELAE